MQGGGGGADDDLLDDGLEVSDCEEDLIILGPNPDLKEMYYVVTPHVQKQRNSRTNNYWACNLTDNFQRTSTPSACALQLVQIEML